MAHADSEDDRQYIEFMYFAHATHKPFVNESKIDINNDIDMYSLTYRNDRHGLMASTFTNSYYKKAFAVTYVRYWNITKRPVMNN